MHDASQNHPYSIDLAQKEKAMRNIFPIAFLVVLIYIAFLPFQEKNFSQSSKFNPLSSGCRNTPSFRTRTSSK